MLEYSGFKIKNHMETVVLQNIDEALKGYDNICKCEQCRCDIMALLLNEITPRYVVTALGEAYMKIQVHDNQFKANIFTAIPKVINIVRNNPRHDKTKE